MASRLRVFISSTMKDLANERDAVCQKLREFDFEPVNAEGWLPDGTTSWERIAEELSTSDLFVLLLGDSYGWVPKSGPKSDTNLSVTHIEYLEAREQGLPVLPFLKKLSYDSDRTSPDALRRDEFRRQVMDWEKGVFRGEFDLARDLSQKVAQALIGVLTREFQRQQVDKRLASKFAAPATRSAEITTRSARPLAVPQHVIDDVIRDGAVLFAGAGMSLATGMPSAPAFAQHLTDVLRKRHADYAGGPTFAAVAADLESSMSRDALLAAIGDMLDPPQGIQPTETHRTALRFFDTILTTNWDELFEIAAGEGGPPLPVVAADTAEIPPRALVKLHGSLADPHTLLITEADISRMDWEKPRLWKSVLSLLRSRPVVTVGSSLRDPSIIRLFEQAQPLKGGYFVAPGIDATAAARLRRWNLATINATAEAFFSALAASRG